eukprot:12972673-Alexandrium_andersonii.AAC.1
MPDGFKARVAPQYFSKVFSVAGRTAAAYGELFLEDHGLKNCTMAKPMVDALACADRLIIEDRPDDHARGAGAQGLRHRAGLLP